MGADLKFAMPLLRALNQTENLRLDYQVLCDKLSMPVQVLEETALAINEIEPLIVQEDADVVLVKKLDLLDPKYISSSISSRGRFALKDVTESTNADLMDEIDRVFGDALVAEIQTKGKSRRDTKWLSAIGSDVTLSMAFKFESHQQLLGFSLAIGVATVLALEQLGVRNTMIKWPNDIYFDNKKLAGILIESVKSFDGGIYAIVGVGLNVHPSATIHRNIDRPYTCLDLMGYELTRNDVCINLINEYKFAANLFRKQGLKPFMNDWKRHDLLYGHQLDIQISLHRIVQGRASGVNPLGELILESYSGRTAVRSGHIVNIRGLNLK